jgi:hypothetical protein
VSKHIERAVVGICHSVKYGKTPPEIHLLAAYLEYLRQCRNHEDQEKKLQAEKDRLIQDAVLKFRRDTAFLRESYTWDWCPIWWVVSQANVFRKLPPVPWRHDGKSFMEE